MEQLSYICIPTRYKDCMETLSNSEKGRLFIALLQWAATGEEPEITGNERYLFPMMRNDARISVFDVHQAENDVHQIEREERKKKERSKEKRKKEEKELSVALEFDVFWAAYPRKVCKKAAMEKFGLARKKNVSLEKMLIALEEQKKTEQWQDVRYIPHASTWLNQERWEDETSSRPEEERAPPRKRYETRLIDGEWVDVEVTADGEHD